jgi:hypothetical protein
MNGTSELIQLSPRHIVTSLFFYVVSSAACREIDKRTAWHDMLHLFAAIIDRTFFTAFQATLSESMIVHPIVWRGFRT